MTLHLLAYGVVLSVFLGGAAYSLDGALRNLGRSTRWLWLSAMVAGALVPFAVPFLPAPAPPSTPQPGIVPLAALYELGDGARSLSVHGIPLSQALERPLLLLWVLSSLSMVLLLVWTVQRLRREERGWPTRTVSGEEVLVSRGLGPAVIGLLKPRIVLPPWALSLQREKLGLVLLHEGEHRAARDPVVLTAGIVLAAVAPLNPALWWMLRQLRLAVEGDCDARVLARGVHPTRYGRFLLDAASGALRGSILSPALVEGAGTSLERRIEMIRKAGKRHWISSLLAVGAGTLFIVLACETPVPPTSLEEDPAVSGSEARKSSALAPSEDVLIRVPGEPLVYVDEVRFQGGPEGLEALPKDEIERIEVIKGAAAAALFGEEGADGVIQVFTVKGSGDVVVGEAPGQLRIRAEDPDRVPAEPLVIVDGVIVSFEGWQEMVDASDIDKIEVMKGDQARALYGERGANGVIFITLKK